MQYALLLGYGAAAVHPYLALAGAGRRGAATLHRRRRQGLAQDLLEDGHLHGAELPRRPDLRGGGPWPAPGRPLLPRHRLPGRRDRDGRRQPHGRTAARAGVRRRPGHRARAANTGCGRVASVTPGTRTRSSACSAPSATTARTASGRTPTASTRPPAPPRVRGLLEPEPVGPAAAARRRSSRRRCWCAGSPVGSDEPGFDQPGGARDAGRRDEPDRRAVEHGRGRRGSRTLGARPRRHAAAFGDQAGRVRQVRRDGGVPGRCRPAPDQDRAGREARRGRAAAGPQGGRADRPAAPLDAGRRPDLAAAAPRHLLDRGSGPADPRPAVRQPGGARFRSSWSPRRGSARSPPASPRPGPTTS